MAKSELEKQYSEVISRHNSGKSVSQIVDETGIPEESVRAHIKAFFRSIQ